MYKRQGQDSARHGKDLARQRVSDRLGQLLTAQAGPDVHLLIELVAADTGDVVAARIEEQRVEIGRGVVDRGRLTRAQTCLLYTSCDCSLACCSSSVLSCVCSLPTSLRAS